MWVVQIGLFGGETRIRLPDSRKPQPAKTRTPRTEPDPSPRMFSARLLEPGEPYRCLDCSAVDCDGTYGPPGMEEITLKDGDTHGAELEDLWFCVRCSHARWAHFLDCQDRLPARRRRLRAFRIAADRGLRRDLNQLFATAERWLRDDTIPESP